MKELSWFENATKGSNPSWAEEWLREALGYADKRSFRKVVLRAMKTCLTLEIDPSTDFRIGPDGSYTFSRFGCLLIAVNCDSKGRQVASVQTPEALVEYLLDCARSIKPEVRNILRSTFISYGQPDERFARKVYEALHSNGVTTFFFKEHALPGRKLHRLIRDCVHKYDRVILICSEASLLRPGVLNEIEETLAREANDGGTEYLLPIRLDDYIFGDEFAEACKRLGKEDFVSALRHRVIGDFCGADKDDAKFTSELLKVLAALKK